MASGSVISLQGVDSALGSHTSALEKRVALGDHAVYRVQNDRGICEHVEALYPAELSQVHLSSDDWSGAANKAEAGQVDVDLHRRFYKGQEKEAFKQKYFMFLLDVARHFYPEEHAVIVQAFPNVRFHMPGTTTVPRHKDSDAAPDRTPHPKGVRNFLFTLTRMEGTSSMYIESAPRRGDFKPVKMVRFAEGRVAVRGGIGEGGPF